MNSNPICHPSPAKKMKCSFFNHIQLLMISWAGQWTQTPSANPLQQKKMKCSFLYYIQLLMLARLVNGLKPHPPPLCSQKNEMLLLWITLNFWWLPGLCDGLKLLLSTTPLQPSAKKNEMLVFGLRSLLMICLADWWTWTSSATPLIPKKWNAQFLITFNFWWSAKLVNGLKVHLPALSSQ